MPKPPLPFALRRRESTGPGLVRILKAMDREARALAAKPESELTESIHHLRTLIKRLRAYLWFLRPALGVTRYERDKSRLRQAARELSEARDLAVILSALTKAALPGVPENDLQALKKISQAFAQEEASRPTSNDDASTSLKKSTDAVVRVTGKITGAMKRTPGKSPSPRHRLKKSWRAARKAKKKALHEKELPLVHEWRKKTKRLLYVLQLTQRLPHLQADDCLEKVDRLQETLGEFQDSVVAETYLQRHSSDHDADDLDRVIYLLQKKRKKLLTDAYRCWRSMPTHL